MISRILSVARVTRNTIAAAVATWQREIFDYIDRSAVFTVMTERPAPICLDRCARGLLETQAKYQTNDVAMRLMVRG